MAVVVRTRNAPSRPPYGPPRDVADHHRFGIGQRLELQQVVAAAGAPGASARCSTRPSPPRADVGEAARQCQRVVSGACSAATQLRPADLARESTMRAARPRSGRRAGQVEHHVADRRHSASPARAGARRPPAPRSGRGRARVRRPAGWPAGARRTTPAPRPAGRCESAASSRPRPRVRRRTFRSPAIPRGRCRAAPPAPAAARAHPTGNATRPASDNDAAARSRPRLRRRPQLGGV